MVSSVRSEGMQTFEALQLHARTHGALHPVALSPDDALIDGDRPVVDVGRVQGMGSAVLPWTVNAVPRMVELLRLGVRGLISDSPDLLMQTIARFEVGGVRGGLLGKDGLLDPEVFDAQGHRGARNLRPENTLPAFEAGLDWLVPTLETDVGLTKDADVVPVLNHNVAIEPLNARRRDGSPFQSVLVRHLTLAEIQADLILDNIVEARKKTQKNCRSLSPVSVAFASEAGLHDAYTLPALEQLFAFTRFYAAYYRDGAGKDHPDAEKRWRNAEQVRFNIETKLTPESEREGRTHDPDTFARAVTNAIRKVGFESRATIQSFDERSLRTVHVIAPEIRTSLLIES